MKQFFKLVPLAFAISALVAPAVLAQGKVEGTVSNGTNGKRLARQQVQLLMPRNGMQPVASATSDGSGHFVFSGADLDPKAFYLASTEFQGASYHAAVAFDTSGSAKVVLTVYDATRSSAGISIPAARLLVGAE